MAATADYLADHPFASPDIVNPPEAPTYKYRPDINSLVDLAGIETVDLSAGSRVDILIDNLLQSWVLQSGSTTGSDLEVLPDDFDADLNAQFWLLVAASTLDFIGVGSLSFGDISGTISVDQLPPGSVVTVESIGEDALYFYTDATGLPSLSSADTTAAFLSGHLSFGDITGTIAIDQFPPGSVATLDSIDESGFYFFDNDLFVPELLGKADTLSFLLPDQTSNDGFFLQTNAGVLSWAAASGGGGGSIASTSNFLIGDGAGAAVASNLTDDGAGDVVYSFSQNNQNNFGLENLTDDEFAACAFQLGVGPGDEVLFTIGAYAQTHAANALLLGGDGWLFSTGRIVVGATGAIVFANDGIATERARINNGLSVGSTTDPGAGNILLNGLTASVFVKTDASKILVSKTASEMRTDLALVIGTNVQAWDTDLDTWATKTPYAGTLTITTAKTFNVTNTLTLSGTDSSTLNVGAGGTLGSAAYTASSAYDVAGAAAAAQAASQPLDSDLTTIAGLTATTDNFIVSVASAWASRTPTQVKTTLGLTIGTNVQAWDADLDTLAGLTATTDNFIVSVASAWASRTPSQVRTTLGLVIGTNVQAWDTDLDSWAAITRASGFDTFVTTPSSANFASLLTDESGSSGGFVRSVGGALSALTGLAIRSTGAAFDLTLASSEVLTAGRTLTIVMGDTGRTLTFTGNASISGTNTGDQDLSGYQPLDSDLTTIAGLTATTDNFIVSVASAWASRTPTQVKTTLGLVIGTNVQAWDADLDTLGSLTATTDNFIVSVSSAWASRTPTQVKTTLGLVIGTNVQAWDADLDTLAGLSATTDNFIVSVSSAWASRTPTQVKTTLGLVIGTNVQAWDADLDTWAGVTPASGIATFLATPSSANLRTAMTDEIGTGACVFDGATLTLLLTTATCGSSLASLNIPAGTVPTTPNDGDVFADANCFYACSDAGNPGFIPVVHVIRADSPVTQANDANAHAIFTTPTNGRLTLEVGLYRFYGLLVYTSMSATSGNVKIDILGAGGATIGTWLWVSNGTDASAAGTAAAAGGSFATTSATGQNAVTAATNTNCNVFVAGTFEVTGAGTIIPTQTLQSAAAAVLAAGSFIEFWRIGSTSMTSVGQWD